MTTIENDLNYLREGVAQLKDYLLGKELLSWQLGKSLPSLTPGNLLLAQTRLQAHGLDDEQQNTLGELINQFQELKKQWRSAWEKKVEDEVIARVRQWGFVIDDLAKDNDPTYFSNMVYIRAILELFKNSYDLKDDDLNWLDFWDKNLRAQFLEGDFIWEAELASAFPKERYWFLYGQLG